MMRRLANQTLLQRSSSEILMSPKKLETKEIFDLKKEIFYLKKEISSFKKGMFCLQRKNRLANQTLLQRIFSEILMSPKKLETTGLLHMVSSSQFF